MKIPNAPMRSSLGDRIPSGPAADAELRQLRSAAWHQQGVVVVRLEDIQDDWDRQHLMNIAIQLYGPKEAR